MAKVNRMWPTEWPKAQSTVNGLESGHGQAGMEELESYEEPFAVLWPKQSVDHDPVTQPWVAAKSARFDIMAPIRSPHLPPPPPKRILFCIHLDPGQFWGFQDHARRDETLPHGSASDLSVPIVCRVTPRHEC